MLARVTVPRVKYPTPAATLGFQRTLLDSLERVPSIRAVGLMTSVPFAPGVRRGVTVHDRSTAAGPSELRASALEQVVSGRVFEALRVTLLAGRAFGEQDRIGSPLVAIASERLARQLWGATDAIGRTLELDGRTHQVVGIVGDIRGTDGTARGGGIDRDPQPVIYLPSTQFPQTTTSLVIRTDAALPSILPVVRAVVGQIDPAIAVAMRPMEEWIVESESQRRMTTTLAAAFAAVALFLTMVGIYGVISYAVSQRTQEIGVRMAIGASARSVVLLVLRTGMTLAAGGITIGLLGAWSMSRGIGSLLFDVSATDPSTFAATALALGAVAALACAVPAIRATRIDPAIAFRSD
jgi:predicted permease